MPIKPVYAERILSGKKHFEFRKTSIRDDVSHFIIYSSFPVQRIVGVAEIGTVSTSSPTRIWEKTKYAAGISRKLFREYFRGSKIACAIGIKKVAILENPIRPEEISNGFKVPQSFSYVDQPFLDRVLQFGKVRRPTINRSGRLIFVGGIHGVGKSTLCDAFSKAAAFEHLTASSLIRDNTTSPLNADKQVNDVGKNQKILASALSVIRQEKKNYVLDGHFTLLDMEGNIRPIPLSTFQTIRPDKLIVVYEDLNIIVARLASRDKRKFDIQRLGKMQDLEISHAYRIGRKLQIPVHTVQSSDSDGFAKLLQE